MRLPGPQAKFLKDGLLEIQPESEVYLFGSGVDENARGGDIDILWPTISMAAVVTKLGEFTAIPDEDPSLGRQRGVQF